MATATITDVRFLGLVPKSIIQVLQKYANDIKHSSGNENKFYALIDQLITASINRVITIQKTIQIMLSQKKHELASILKDETMSNITCQHGILVTLKHNPPTIPTLRIHHDKRVTQPNAEFFGRRVSSSGQCTVPIIKACAQDAIVRLCATSEHFSLSKLC